MMRARCASVIGTGTGFIRACVLIAAACLLSSCFAQAPDESLYSDIFFVNNTGEPLSVEIQQTGDSALLANEHYVVYEKTLAAFTTARVLRINRRASFIADQKFLFSARVVGESMDFELNQKLVASGSDTSMSFGATLDNVTLPFESDTAVHRATLRHQDGSASEFAFRATAKATYADIHYVLSEAYPPAKLDPSPDKLSVLTYNIWALPLVSSDIVARLKAMPQYLAQYDVLLLQEAFSGERVNLINRLEESYGYTYATKILRNTGFNILDGGVILLSRHPIVNQAQFYFTECSGADCLSDKGVNYMEIVKGGRSYHIFSSHTASFDNDVARAYRQNQFRQMRDFAQSMNIPKNETVIFGGDFNVNKLIFPDDYRQMLETLDASEPEYIGYTASTFDPFLNLYASVFGSGGDHIEYIDYVLVSNQYAAPSSTVNKVRIPRSTVEPMWGLWNLSDHFPVEAFIE